MDDFREQTLGKVTQNSLHSKPQMHDTAKNGKEHSEAPSTTHKIHLGNMQNDDWDEIFANSI